MNRVKENKTVLDRIAKDIHGGCLLSANMKVDELLVLGDISKSLAVIVDKMGEEEPENCVGCKHLTDPCELFPTDACKRCCRHYGDRYEREVTE